MRQVIQNLRDGSIHVSDVSEPVLRPGGILVRTACSILSSGTEGARTVLARENLLGKARRRPDLVRQVLGSVKQSGLRATVAKVRDRLDSPKAPGYALAGTVMALAPGVSGFRRGDRVACAGEGFASHAEIVFVPRNLAAIVPDGVGPQEAAFATLGAIALHGVRQSDARLGETVVVIGLGLIGQLAWQILEASGVNVIGIDVAEPAVARARALGLQHSFRVSDSLEQAVLQLTGGLGADGVLITAGAPTSEPVVLAGHLSRDRGRVVLLGNVRSDIPRSPYYEKEIEVRMSRSYGPGRYDPDYEERGQDYPIGYVRWTERRNLEAFLSLIATDRLRVQELVSHRFPVRQAEEAYSLLCRPSDGAVSAIALTYGDSEEAVWPPSAKLDDPSQAPAATQAEGARRRNTTGPHGIALLGAGNFARSQLLPVILADSAYQLTGVATAHPHTAEHIARRFGFEFASTDPQEILNDPGTRIVFIATRHDSHAVLAQAALEAGKAVFVEKPLALNGQSLQEVLAASGQPGALLCVGFNRRLAPLLEQLKAELPTGVPRQILIRVNAGPLPPDHWLLDPLVGGGRLIGEGCHFFDLACCLAEDKPARVSASGTSSSFTASVEFQAGTTATIFYSSDGQASLAKERIEVYAGGTAVVLDDFHSLELHKGGRRKRIRRRRVDKGHRALVEAFLGAVAGGSQAPMTIHDIESSHRLTFAAAEELQDS